MTRPAKRRRRRRRRRVQDLQRRARLPAMTMIADRTPEVENRAEVGHREGGRATWKVARGELLYQLEAHDWLGQTQ